MTTSKIFITLADEEDQNWALFIELLKENQEIIRTSIGPIKGQFKLLASKHDHVSNLIFTSSSSLLVDVLYNLSNSNRTKSIKIDKKFEFTKWKFDLIGTLLKNSFISRYYDSGLFASYLINEFLVRNKEYSLLDMESIEVIDLILEQLVSHLPRSSIVLKTDLNNLKFLKNLIKTVLNSKCLIEQIDNEQKEKLINLSLKAFVESFCPNESGHFSIINFLFNENFSCHLEESQLFAGVLFRIDSSQLMSDFWQLMDIKRSSNNRMMKSVLFDASFAADFELLDSQDVKIQIDSQSLQESRNVFLLIRKMIQICEFLIEKFKIDVLLSQKVIFKKYILICSTCI